MSPMTYSGWLDFYTYSEGMDETDAEKHAVRRVHEQAERERLRQRAELEQRRSETAVQALLRRARESARNGG